MRLYCTTTSSSSGEEARTGFVLDFEDFTFNLFVCFGVWPKDKTLV